jgi:3-oxoacyl-(acyl-carrier-protein) synthase
MPQNNTRVVITGIGPIGSVGIGKEQFWNGLVNKNIGLAQEDCILDGKSWAKFFAHRVKGFDINNFSIGRAPLGELKKWQDSELITDLLYQIAAIKLAVVDSGLTYDPDDNDVGLLMTHENFGLENYFFQMFSQCYDAYQNSATKRTLNRRDFYHLMYQRNDKRSYELQAFMPLFHVAKIFNLHGFSLFLNNACASGLYALESAAQLIQAGRNKAIIVSTSECPTAFKYFWFNNIGMYSPSGKIKPFIKNSDGFVFGDAAGSIVLEELEQAKARKAHIYAEYVGGGFNLESWKVFYPKLGGDFYLRAITQAIAASGIERGSVDLVCAHGAGNKIIDTYELRAITDLFGDKFSKPYLTAFKPYIGHTLGACSLVESIILLLCMDNNIILPVLNIQEPLLQQDIPIVREKMPAKIHYALKICTAFAGYNGAALFKKHA